MKQKLHNLKSLNNFIFRRLSEKKQNSIDQNEVKTFSKVNDWWSTSGSMRPLHSYNIERVKYMEKIINQGVQKSNPFQNLNMLDVGCGGGLLTESLARLGANVTGIDATKESVEQAQLHQSFDPFLKINYIHTTAEEHIQQIIGRKYDVVSSMEVIEHVNNPHQFVESLAELVKPQGIIFISTINKTMLSYLQVIVAAEYITRIVPLHTHHYKKFITPQNLQNMCSQANLDVINIQGFLYNPWTEQMNPSSSTEINYILSCIKKIN